MGAESRGDGFGEVSAAHAHSGRAEIDDDAKVFPHLRRPHLSPTTAPYFSSSLSYIF